MSFTEDSEFDIIFLSNEVKKLKELLLPLADPNRNGVALAWNSPLQKRITNYLNKDKNK